MKYVVALLLALSFSPLALGQNDASGSAGNPLQREAEIRDLRAELRRLSARLDALEGQPAINPGSSPAAATASPGAASASPGAASASSTTATATALTANGNAAPASAQAPGTGSVASAAVAQTPQQTESTPEFALPKNLPGGATLNYTFDGYYEYNFNQPPGRVNNLRAYDVLSNTFSLNQADLIFDLDPDLSKGRRYGVRVDLQFGQATDTLQANPANEPRPGVYQNIFQAYGSYIVPIGKGLGIDFGKWASSIGVEGNYTKDQLNYTRSFYFYFLPFYHAGVRSSYRFNDKFAVNYWIVNGNNQTEPTNGYKDELFGFVLTPKKNVTWTSNYYIGQEHPSSGPANNCTGPVQPGLCVVAINPAPNGKLHIFDDYVTWQATRKLLVIGEGDYVIQRLWANAAPGESSAPQHVSGGAGYLQYQATPKISLAVRGEYLSDRGGLFSATTQALKEGTGTYKYSLGEGLDAFLEYRHDWSNLPYFTTNTAGYLSGHQNTATLGLVWWYGGKQGTW